MVYVEFLKTINKSKPQIHVLTNNVTNHFVADVLLALGCRPVMAFDKREVTELTAGSDALCINIGTPHTAIEKSYFLSLKSAQINRVPVALDFPGVGASRLRQNIAFRLLGMLHNKGLDPKLPVIIRGNASEIYCLADRKSHGGSIDSIHSPEDVVNKSRSLLHYVPGLCISGQDNYVLGRDCRIIPGGNLLMTRSSGFGCISTALMAAFLSCHHTLNTPDFSADAAAGVCRFMAVCAETLTGISGPAEFRNHFIDRIYEISEEENKDSTS